MTVPDYRLKTLLGAADAVYHLRARMDEGYLPHEHGEPLLALLEAIEAGWTDHPTPGMDLMMWDGVSLEVCRWVLRAERDELPHCEDFEDRAEHWYIEGAHCISVDEMREQAAGRNALWCVIALPRFNRGGDPGPETTNAPIG